MSLARRHRERMTAQLAASKASGSDDVSPVSTDGTASGAFVPAGGNAETTDPVAAQIRIRFTHDRRRLKEIQSLEKKIEAKQEMIPEYAPWIEGLIAAAQADGVAMQEDILPTIMVWKIDTGDYAGALDLAEHVLRYKLTLPSQYERTVGTLVAEEIAEAALKALAKGNGFDPAVLDRAAELTQAEDMPDEVRAKLVKAIGLELVQQADADESDDLALAKRAIARGVLDRARELHPKCGVTKQLEKLDRQLKAAAAEQNSGTAQSG